MHAISLHDRAAIRALLRRDPELHAYGLGDLDDFFWPYTSWYTLREERERQPVALIYSGGDLPVLLAIDEQPAAALADLLRAMLPLLPRRVYAHLSADAATGSASALMGVLGEVYRIESHGVYYKMALRDRSRLDAVDTAGVARMSPADLAEIEALYAASYPGHWFDPRMLETGQYYGLRREPGEGRARLVCVAGVHVYSPAERVAAIGNVATHPDVRGQGLARTVCARLAGSLLETVDHVGLNVRADNASALAAYANLGFERIAVYEECMLELR